MRRALLLAALLAMFGGVVDAEDTESASRAELRAAIDILKTLHINRGRIDWPSVESEAFRRVRDGNMAADAYPAIRYVIAQLKEKHTLLIDADQWQADMSGKPVAGKQPVTRTPPQFRTLEDRTGYIAIPTFMGGDRAIAAYTANVRAGIEALRQGGACRFVVDLRGNMGGNMWPMLNGLASLLGSPPYGYFETGSTITSTWAPRNGEILPLDGVVAVAPPRVEELAPIAILLDRKTASSGEFVAMAFEGRVQTRFFGEPSAGFVSVNELYALPDGARLALTIGLAQDRLHRRYAGAIVPDETAAPGEATLAAARAWLKAQPCPTGH